LAGRVPLYIYSDIGSDARSTELNTHDLELYSLSIHVDSTGHEIDTDRSDPGRLPDVVAEPLEEAGLADAYGREKQGLNLIERGVMIGG
jgi:hypothetical protein